MIGSPFIGDFTIREEKCNTVVTADVLRGEKSRFQLFGHTVNTSARMESTGLPGRIQVSHAAAHYLVATLPVHTATIIFTTLNMLAMLPCVLINS